MEFNKKGQEVKYIRTEDLKKIREYLKYKNKITLLNFINIGVNVGLRISDLSTLRFEDIDMKTWTLTLIEKKTQKKRTIKFNSICQKAIKELKSFYQGLGYSIKEGYLFKSLSPYQKKFKLDSPFTINGVSRKYSISSRFSLIKKDLGKKCL